MKTQRKLLFGAGALLASAGVFAPNLFSGVIDGIVPEEGAVIPGVGEPGGPERQLTAAEQERFLAGLQLFDHDFHMVDGLGTPENNADSCRACHQDPAIGGAGGLELNVSRFGSNNGGAGPFVDLTGGQGLSKFRPPIVDGREEYDPMQADVFEQRQTPSILGDGLIDGIPDLEILANEDPGDIDGDGIRGVARRIDVGGGVTEIGRFGWKGQVPHLRDFILDAMGGETGITTPDDGRGFALVSDNDAVPDPEFSDAQVEDMLFYLSNLAAPRRKNPNDIGVLRGEYYFEQVGCNKCHIPSLMGANEPVFLYSDLLLHNVAAPDFQGMEEPGAPSGFYQTPPLWGVSETAPYMHDGRAETIHDAILAHRGEALSVRQAYVALNGLEKRALTGFVLDL